MGASGGRQKHKRTITRQRISDIQHELVNALAGDFVFEIDWI